MINRKWRYITTSSFLGHISTPTFRLITTEDPVEYYIEDMNQSHVNAEILTFVAILRSMLRQNPEIIILGKIRDSEAGYIAMYATITGPLVFSTLHANDDVGSKTRFRNI